MAAEAVYFCITLILALIGWTGLARVVRGRFLSLREEDFVMAARFTDCSERGSSSATWCRRSPATSSPP